MRNPKPLSTDVEQLLRQSWPGLRVEGRMSGGARTEVWSAFMGDRRVVLRHSRRSAQSRTWEWDLLQHLDRVGVAVPRLVPAVDGTFDLDGWHVYPYIEGIEPQPNDPRLIAAIGAVHAETVGWPQRPGSASASHLLTSTTGGDIDLRTMPGDLVDTLREAWRSALSARPAAVVHGDCGPRNALVDEQGRCVLIDWDEARVDDSLFDSPTNGREERAALAWEIATCWSTEPSYARSLIESLPR